MAGPHFKKHLIHEATVQRKTDGRSSSGELIPSWSDIGTINCRYVEKQERIADEAQGFMMLLQHMLLCNQDEDVIVEDRITNIILRSDGSPVDAGTFTVESLLKRSSTGPHHISLRLERVE